jgi:glucuronate isomerase
MTDFTEDRLLPVDPAARAVARDLYASVRDLPIISPHGHVDAGMLRRDDAWTDPTQLLISSDHYVTRLLHAGGVSYEALGLDTGRSPGIEGWRTFVDHWFSFAGTASGYWIEQTLRSVFGIEEPLSPENGDAAYARIAQRLGEPSFAPRALFDAFGIEALATTDDPLDDLQAHAALAADASFRGRVMPTFRPDRYLDPEGADFEDAVTALTAGAGATTFAAYLEALRMRREHFIAHGAVSADHGVAELLTIDLGDDAPAFFDRALRGSLSPYESQLFRGHMLLEMGRMSARDGLVMTIHPGVRRNHHTAAFERFGADRGHDIPLATRFTDELRPLLQEVGLAPGMHIVLFAVDETTYSREIAPLAGFYPSVFIGAPWWFLDAPDAGMRFREAVTETAGFTRNSGFIDDTRAFLSIPARHDMSRRLDAAFLARLVIQGRVRPEAAFRIIHDQVDAQPRKVFKL